MFRIHSDSDDCNNPDNDVDSLSWNNMNHCINNLESGPGRLTSQSDESHIDDRHNIENISQNFSRFVGANAVIFVEKFDDF